MGNREMRPSIWSFYKVGGVNLGVLGSSFKERSPTRVPRGFALGFF